MKFDLFVFNRILLNVLILIKQLLNCKNNMILLFNKKNKSFPKNQKKIYFYYYSTMPCIT